MTVPGRDEVVDQKVKQSNYKQAYPYHENRASCVERR